MTESNYLIQSTLLPNYISNIGIIFILLYRATFRPIIRIFLNVYRNNPYLGPATYLKIFFLFLKLVAGTKKHLDGFLKK
jgi:hypothetical protein